MDLIEVSTQLLRVLDLLGVAANALLAGALAHSRRFDPVGFLFLGVVSGLGGGMLRDTLLQAGTPVAFTDPAYLAVALLVSVFAYFVLTDGTWWRRSLRFLDAVALGTWGAVGAQNTPSCRSRNDQRQFTQFLETVSDRHHQSSNR